MQIEEAIKLLLSPRRAKKKTGEGGGGFSPLKSPFGKQVSFSAH